MKPELKTPKDFGFTHPAEFEPQQATWLSWPHSRKSWPGKGALEKIFPSYCKFVEVLSRGQKVRINVCDKDMQNFAKQLLRQENCNFKNIEFFHHPTNEAWCRDHGPAFIINRKTKEKAILNWNYNAWGNKHDSIKYDLDNEIPGLIAKQFGLRLFEPRIIMEGGAVDFNGNGTLLTTKSCLLNPNRNPHLTQDGIEWHLRNYYGVKNVLWLDDGIEGDDTDGHIDDITRFISHNTVVTMIEHDIRDKNYEPLKKNCKKLEKMRLENGKHLNIVEIPMPTKRTKEELRLPASYANFYISNKHVIVPTFRNDLYNDRALITLQKHFFDRHVVGIDSTDIIWGLGSFHCLAHEEPAI